jgi:hypothetical protein
VVKATNQPDKKNLSVFSAGTPRSYVIAEVGSPTFTEEKMDTGLMCSPSSKATAKGPKSEVRSSPPLLTKQVDEKLFCLAFLSDTL